MNQLRYGFFSAYRRIFAVTFTINIAAMIVMIILRVHSRNYFSYSDAATATGANVAAAVIMRHEHFVNILFRAATAFPYSTPLCIRRHAARIYSYGGVHTACGVSASFWYIFFIVLLAIDFNGPEFSSARVESYLIASFAGVILAVLIVIMALSHPSYRIKHHDAWEMSHRFGGWTVTAFFWAQTIVSIVVTAKHTGQSTGLTLAKTPLFWLLVVITACLIYPWLRLRKREVEATQLSDHALKLTFTHKDAHHPGMATRLSDAPLKETHGFAVIPTDKFTGEDDGYECIISNAGNWTKKMIENPQTHVWVKGTLGFGALNVVSLFKPVVVVATGSGIAPCLSFLRPHGAHTGYPLRVLWSARNPEETYGPGILRTVTRADPAAVIIDTKKTGTPNMTALSYALYRESHCEAVMIISNAKVTREVVYGLESRGIPAFGAIFDS
ncbi:hypothetical protein K431DRAFT_248326 [Polychaeton citri CBS 116435]|uniref:Integral membrane protein TmpA n=1 Tax=Polychaeton citri CBS 116435 TaxID=1314669 RepID=A0A9P4UQD8_9PEZI|nr:hypothetical protein K431DRAFT_248326 [Polychaeton citri CBS 116435]